MQKKYRYRLDRRGRRITAAVTTLLVTAFVSPLVWGANYLPAWMLFLLLCVVLLYILSIPRYVSLDDTSIDIHCIVDLTRIHLDVELIRRIEPDEFRRLWPLFGSYGFSGLLRLLFQLPGVEPVQGLRLRAQESGTDRRHLRRHFHHQLRTGRRADHARHRGTRPQESRDSPPYGKNTGRRRMFFNKMFIFALSDIRIAEHAGVSRRPIRRESLLRRTGIPGFKILNPVISCSLTSN